ncbi:HNH endonuclease [Streptomyces sp. PSKA30]|uniref:HNH endonuclease n=1 Tax=Streptomyces sp. PSKA30 TaxID=2874597 RepID=UPI0035B3D5A0
MAGKIEVDSESGCWLWTGSCNREGPSGYGIVRYQGKTHLVHRVGFRLLVGEIPEGFQVSHAQPRWPHHTRCCNPNHLEAVTREEALGRRDWDRARARRTHCRHGHAYTPENTYLDPRGFQQCRACRSERNRSS